MIRPGVVWTIARSEARLTRRLARYWVFGVLSALLGGATWGWYAFLHYQWSAYSATAAVINPRYLLGFVGFYYLMVFIIGLVFLGFDVRARDVRDRISEVVDSLPCSNLELVFGRYIGILIPSWIPVAVIALVLALIGLAVGETIQTQSLITFVVTMAIPAFTFVLGLVFLVTLLLRHRGLAAIALLIALVAVFAAGLLAPSWMAPLTDISGAFSVPFPSDMIGVVIDFWGGLQRIGILLLGLALLALAAAVYPRPDHLPRSRSLMVALGLALVGLLLLLSTVWVFGGAVADYRVWKEAHAARVGEPAPDVQSMSGNVSIRPGREIALELRTRFRAPADAGLERALFTLNPGLRIESLADADGAQLDFSQENGLVDVALAKPLAPGEEGEIAWTARGEPQQFFAYLDTEQHLMETKPMDGNVFMLGYENLIFKGRSVVLPEGVRWLPAAGPEVGRGDPRRSPTDFFELDLTVELPAGWLAAGPARRQEVAGAPDGRVRFRFAPPAPVPTPALAAGPYEARSMEVEGVLVEILVHPNHAAGIDYFEDAVGEIRDRIARDLKEAAEVGLAYPYDAITMVEVPMSLRCYGDGWRKPSVMGPPAMLLLREASLPTARFDPHFDDPDEYRDREGGLPRAKVEMLERFFENDFNGGNPFVAAARSFFPHQTAAAGEEGLPLDFVAEDLTTRLVTQQQGFFSVYVFDRNINEYITEAIGNYFANRGRQQRGFAESMIDSVTSRLEVWDRVLGTSLVEMDPWEDPETALNALTLKGGAMSRSLLDGYGREKAGAVLATLRENRRGGRYRGEDVVAAGRAAGLDLSGWIDLWIRQTALPGFVAEPVRVYRATDGEDGTPRYAARFVLRNDEEVPGLVRVVYGVGEADEQRVPGGGDVAFVTRDQGETEPIRVEGRSAVEIGLLASQPFRWIEVDPYLSLNREAFDVDLPPLDRDTIVEEEPFRGDRPAAYRPPEPDWIVVDDLSDGFDIIEEGQRSSLRLGQRKEAEETDQGLPVARFGQPPSEWSRATSRNAWGVYRHTYAITRKGQGRHKAVFAAQVPSAGRWELEIHVPRTSRVAGTWNLAIEDPSGGSQPVSFDAASAAQGWNPLGGFEIDAGDVRVVLSDETDGRIVMADAIRWIPSRAAPDTRAATERARTGRRD